MQTRRIAANDVLHIVQVYLIKDEIAELIEFAHRLVATEGCVRAVATRRQFAMHHSPASRYAPWQLLAQERTARAAAARGGPPDTLLPPGRRPHAVASQRAVGGLCSGLFARGLRGPTHPLRAGALAYHLLGYDAGAWAHVVLGWRGQHAASRTSWCRPTARRCPRPSKWRHTAACWQVCDTNGQERLGAAQKLTCTLSSSYTFVRFLGLDKPRNAKAVYRERALARGLDWRTIAATVVQEAIDRLVRGRPSGRDPRRPGCLYGSPLKVSLRNGGSPSRSSSRRCRRTWSSARTSVPRIGSSSRDSNGSPLTTNWPSRCAATPPR